MQSISVFREDCNITIRGNLLKFYLGGRVKYRYTINTEYDLKGVLWEYFGIAVDYRFLMAVLTRMIKFCLGKSCYDLKLYDKIN